MTPTANGRPATCEIPGCSRRMHGAGLCRTHYDEQRYLASTGRDPAAAAAAESELSIRAELEYGAVGTTRSRPGPCSMTIGNVGRRGRSAVTN